MSLLRLPPETLKQIFDHIGSSFFREDLRRLTVCKQWLEFARPVCFKYTALSQETLGILVSREGMKLPSPLKDSLETLVLELEGYQAWISIIWAREYAKKSNVSKTIALNEAVRSYSVNSWIKVLDNDLAQLAIMAQEFRRLRILRIRAWNAPSRFILDMPEDCLSLPTMQALLSLENLNVLVLDLSVNFLISSGEQGDNSHICPAIGTLLHTLRTLHLRMRSICPDVLKPRYPNDRLCLSVAVINLNLTMHQPGIASAAHSIRCGPLSGEILQLKEDIREQAEALVSRMASPKLIRILSHAPRSFETESLDVLTGKTMILDDDMEWDEDGKTVKEEDSEPESDILDDDEFAAYLDEE
ncbi:hypothetical protein G7Z17_g7622 [Cylindrodendrum hubeiense]|uniref:F-box domain-containing protein n=1 Tax=Cylindrodendrum hubeiense TaxID=595255 RepID=A0A9P5LF47_9HYPO|nr:hypothetical protein G7Z17_g7622 [Cylindrodendrum hubeiense]